MKLILLAIFLGNMNVTSYRSVPEQTDSSPFLTATGERVHPYGCAVSQDLLVKNGGPLKYGDWIYIEGYGIKVVNDTMHKRMKNHVDIWVKTRAEEKKIGWKKGRVWKIKSEVTK